MGKLTVTSFITLDNVVARIGRRDLGQQPFAILDADLFGVGRARPRVGAAAQVCPLAVGGADPGASGHDHHADFAVAGLALHRLPRFERDDLETHVAPARARGRHRHEVTDEDRVNRRRFLERAGATAAGITVGGTAIAKGTETRPGTVTAAVAPANEREYWVTVARRLSEPVLTNLAAHWRVSFSLPNTVVTGSNPSPFTEPPERVSPPSGSSIRAPST